MNVKAPQFTWGTDALDNGSWRRIHGDYGISAGTSGTLTFTIAFRVVGDTETELMERVAATVATFSGTSKAFKYTNDKDAATPKYYPDVTPFTNEARDTQCFVEDDPTRVNTGKVRHLSITAIALIPNILAGSGGGTTAGVGEFRVTTSYNAGRVVSKSFLGRFLSASGSTGEQVYAAQRNTILSTHLGTGTDGAPSPTGLALVNESIEKQDANGNEVLVLLQSDVLPANFRTVSTLRSLALETTGTIAEEWQPGVANAGARPFYVEVAGVAAFSAGDPYQNFNLLLPGLIAEAAAIGGGAPALLSQSVTPNPKLNEVRFRVLYQCRNGSTLRVRRTVTVMEDTLTGMHRASDGTVRVQRPDGPPDTEITVDVTIRKLGAAMTMDELAQAFDNPLPTLPDRDFVWLKSRRAPAQEAIETDFGSVTEQSYTSVWGAGKSAQGNTRIV